MKAIPVGVSIRQDLLKKIDEKRGCVPRSRFISDVLEKELAEKRKV